MFYGCPRSTPALELLAQPEQLERGVAARELLGAQTPRSEEASAGGDAAPGGAASSAAAQWYRSGAIERPLEVGVDVPLQRRLGAEPLPAAGHDAGERPRTAVAEGHVTLQPLPGTRAPLEHLAALPPTEVDTLVPGLSVHVSPSDVVAQRLLVAKAHLAVQPATREQAVFGRHRRRRRRLGRGTRRRRSAQQQRRRGRHRRRREDRRRRRSRRRQRYRRQCRYRQRIRRHRCRQRNRYRQRGRRRCIIFHCSLRR